MTVRQLLSHTAGVSDTAQESERSLTPRGYDRFARVAAIGQRPLDFAPGSAWRYSNAGYIVLGALIERITGTSRYSTLDRQFFERLALRHTGYATPGRCGQDGSRATPPLPARSATSSSSVPPSRTGPAAWCRLQMICSAGAVRWRLSLTKSPSRHFIAPN